ncbi:MAG: hypothetical protein RBS55_08795 [Bacteroidales bacterium]|jgi:photosystem II stability/assembly factor-like uncharacterized protein|nr:hypothetical protein [Bacteroidales bacterium]
MKKFLVLVSLFLASGMSSAQWITQNTNTDGNFTDIVFVDEMTGWAVMADDYPQVHYTTDGGQTWQWCFELFGLLQGTGTSVSFFDADNGWLSDGANIFHTADGSAGCGSEWINQATESITMVSTSLHFADA